MDLSAVIFAAVAVAWAVYLVPKAIRHHDEADRSRSVERFSESMRVLARRDAVSARDARLVVPERDAARGREVQQGQQPARRTPTAAELRARRLAARRATRRRRRVLGVLLGANAVVGGLAVAGVLAVAWVAAPAATLAAWLVACRLMVRGEHAVWVELTAPATEDEVADDAAPRPVPAARVEVDADADTGDVAPVAGERADEGAGDEPEARPALAVAETTAHAADGRRLWDPVPMTLPTYVNKATAVRRTVRTIDLDATGVWTSGRTDEDARIAQATARRVAREAGEADGEAGRAVGS